MKLFDVIVSFEVVVDTPEEATTVRQMCIEKGFFINHTDVKEKDGVKHNHFYIRIMSRYGHDDAITKLIEEFVDSLVKESLV